MVIMEDNNTKAAIVQQHRGTRIGDGTTDTSISPPNAEITILSINNTNAESSASPSPLSGTDGGQTSPNQNVYLIGLEFVRQYYTVLHQGPLYLHRFYSEQSSFVHDDSKVVYGQQEIRDRIEQLNFRNCVAKILQVDSQETLGNGVVIQVRGELSNNGKPLRRFMQTFVLAPQSPKRYYVRNDIFHYQDDESCKDDLSGRLDSPLPNERGEDEGSEAEVEDEDLNDSGSHVPSVSAGSPASVTETPALVSKEPEIPPPVEPAAEIPVPEVSLLDTKAEPKVEGQQRRPSHGFLTTGASVAGDIVAGGRGHEQAKEPDQVAPPPSAPTGGMKTFANLFKSDLTSAASSGTPEFSHSRSPFPTKPVTGRLGPSPTVPAAEGEAGVASPTAVSPQPATDTAGKTLPPRGNFGRGDRDRGYSGGYKRERLTSRSSNATANDETGSIDGDNQRPRSIHNYPDSHQLFVGNLPHTVTIEEVKGIFEVYGRVPEVKILKPNQKNAGPKVPYFCFVVFEDQASAEAAVRDKSKITMRMPDGVNRRLNVEEKRPREVGQYGGGPPGGGFYPREPRGDNSINAGGGGSAGPQQGSGNNNFRSGGAGRGGGMANPPGGKELSGNEYRSSQQNNPRTHSRTFRGSNRGGGGVSGGADRGGGAR